MIFKKIEENCRTPTASLKRLCSKTPNNIDPLKNDSTKLIHRIQFPSTSEHKIGVNFLLILQPKKTEIGSNIGSDTSLAKPIDLKICCPLNPDCLIIRVQVVR